jgi:hypothetical protein
MMLLVPLNFSPPPASCRWGGGRHRDKRHTVPLSRDIVNIPGVPMEGRTVESPVADEGRGSEVVLE